MPMTPEPTVTVAPTVLEPSELARRIGELRSEIAERLGDPMTMSPGAASLAVRARRLHEMWWTVAPPDNPAGSGLRGRLGYEARRTTRRLVGWYVEPRLVAQREIDAEIARFATETAAALHRLQTEIERVGSVVERLQRDFAATRSDRERSNGEDDRP
jgi:hypothetical protein